MWEKLCRLRLARMGEYRARLYVWEGNFVQRDKKKRKSGGGDEKGDNREKRGKQ